MLKIIAKGVSAGKKKGVIKVLDRDNGISKEMANDREIEDEKLSKSLEKSTFQLEKLEEKSTQKGIFEAHLMMLQDPEVIATIENYLDSGYTAEYAIFRAKDDLKNIFLSMEDEYFRARANDIEDVLTRLINNIKGKETSELNEPFILVSDELYPSETLEMDFKNLRGIATLRGSVTSHTTILANNLKIPAIISMDVDRLEDLDGKIAIIDGTEGILYVDPDESKLLEFEKYTEEKKRKDEELKKFIHEKSKTKSGQVIEVYANIGRDIEAESAYENGAEGIGLFRSEFLFLGRSSAPDEEEQYRAYRNALNFMNGRPVIIRTLDLGADKQVDYLNMEEEDNPQMGLRAIRLCLKNEDLFKTQLRALLRASAHGPLRIMLPMIISVNEIKNTRKLIEECKVELEKEGHKMGDIELGIMIETPAAAIDSENLAKEVDFFSIGTNDLVSYTLALDRTNTRLNQMRDDHHPAVLKLIEMTAHAATNAKIPVGICGQMAQDRTLLDFFIEIGIDELSVSVGEILELKKEIMNKD